MKTLKLSNHDQTILKNKTKQQQKNGFDSCLDKGKTQTKSNFSPKEETGFLDLGGRAI